MKIAIIGGIYGMPDEFRKANLQETVETLLERGLRARGHEVTTYGHRDLVRARRHDVVHAHHLATGCVQMIAQRGVPFVFSRHATKSLAPHHAAVLRLTYQRADRVIAASDFEMGLIESMGVPAAKLRRIYNGIDADHFVPTHRQPPAADEPWQLVVIGQLIELKRTHKAIELTAELIRQGTPVVLNLVYQRDTLLEELRSQARRLGVEDSVVFHGPLGREAVGELIAQSHILVHPSRTEALPTVVTESVLSALPVVAFDVGGMREQVADQSLVLERDRTDLLLPTVQRVIEDYPSAAERSHLHAGSARRQFDLDTMIDEHERVYAEVVRRRP